MNPLHVLKPHLKTHFNNTTPHLLIFPQAVAALQSLRLKFRSKYFNLPHYQRSIYLCSMALFCMRCRNIHTHVMCIVTAALHIKHLCMARDFIWNRIPRWMTSKFYCACVIPENEKSSPLQPKRRDNVWNCPHVKSSLWMSVCLIHLIQLHQLTHRTFHTRA